MLEIDNWWTTPIGRTKLEMPKDMRATLTELVERQDPCKTSDTYDGVNRDYTKFEEKVYNLFDYTRYSNEPFEIKAIAYLKEFEQAIGNIIRTYIFRAWGLDNCNIKVRAFGNASKTYSRRIPPHFHHGWDGVALTYLSIGQEFYAKDNDTQPTPKNTEHSGNLIMQDPRPAINFPFTDKAKVIKPEVGLTIVHPAYLWHETEVHTLAGLRSCLVVDFKILTQNCDYLPTPLGM